MIWIPVYTIPVFSLHFVYVSNSTLNMAQGFFQIASSIFWQSWITVEVGFVYSYYLLLYLFFYSMAMVFMLGCNDF